MSTVSLIITRFGYLITCYSLPIDFWISDRFLPVNKEQPFCKFWTQNFHWILQFLLLQTLSYVSYVTHSFVWYPRVCLPNIFYKFLAWLAYLTPFIIANFCIIYLRYLLELLSQNLHFINIACVFNKIWPECVLNPIH